MTGLLNSIARIGNYAGAGMVMLVVGIILTGYAIFRLSRMRVVDRKSSVREFNRQFAQDTGAGVSDIESGARKRALAMQLGIRTLEDDN